MAGKKKQEQDKRCADALSDDSLTSTPKLKQPKISSFVQNSTIDEIDRNENEDNDTEISLQDVVREIRLLEKKFERMIGDKIGKLKENFVALENEKNTLQTEVKILQKTNNELSTKMNDLEQYTRRNNLRIFGIQEVSGDWETSSQSEEKIIDLIQQKLNLPHITSDHIEACHRVGRYREGKNRPIIVRFLSRKTKEIIIKERKKLKGSGVIIAEDLTKVNAAWFFEIKSIGKSIPSVSSVWTQNGETYIYGPAGKVKIPRDFDLKDLPEILKPKSQSDTAKSTRPRPMQMTRQQHQ